MRRRVSASRSARFFSSYFRFSLISLDTMIVELDAGGADIACFDGRSANRKGSDNAHRGHPPARSGPGRGRAATRPGGPLHDRRRTHRPRAHPGPRPPPRGVRCVIGGDRPGGAFSLVEHPLPPRALGAPLHPHHNEDEYSYVLEGRFGVQLGNQVLEAGPGDLLCKPRGVAHAFWNAGDEPARLLELISPAGFENYFREMAPLLAAPERDQAAIGEVVARYQLDIDFTTIPTLAEQHHLRLR